jgi:hydroxypyruvate isomerase
MSNPSSMSRRGLLARAAAGAAAAAVLPRSVRAETAAPKRKGRFQQSVSKWCYDKTLSYEDLCRHAARIGYKGIDLIGPEEYPTAKKHGLCASIVRGAGTIPKGFNRKANHGALLAGLRKDIDFAAANELPNVICFSGNREGLSDEEGVRVCVEGLKQIAGYAEQKKVNVCMEYLNSKVNHKDYQFDRIAFGAAVCKGVGSPRVGILYDIYHAQIMEGDLIRTIREHHEHILHYHTGGNPGRNEIDETQEINYRAVMQAIAETGYTGFVGQEFVPKGDAVRALERAFEICDV